MMSLVQCNEFIENNFNDDSEPEQLRDLLALERMKVKMLEENLRQKEEQSNTNDKLYEDFRTK